jgi:hypothetical protein
MRERIERVHNFNNNYNNNRWRELGQQQGLQWQF